MQNKKAVAGQGGEYNLQSREAHVLDWQPFLGDILRAPTVGGRLLTVKFHNTRQRDAWLTAYREKTK
jgi:hypothetical protein